MSKVNSILVTGSKGQLGSEFALIAKNDTTHNFIFKSRASLDITDEKALQSIFQENEIEFVINCAAYTNVDKAEEEKEQCEMINTSASALLAKTCALHKATLIHISTDYVYHPDHQWAISEDMTCKPRGVYASSKLEGEHRISKHLTKHIILRTSWVYSSFGNNFVKTMLRLAKSRNELNVVDDQIGSPTYARDLAESIMHIIKKLRDTEIKDPLYGIYNYSNLGFISWADFAIEIFKQKSIDMVINRIPTSEYPTLAERPLNSRLSKSKITDVFNLHLSKWNKSLSNCLKEIDN